MNQLGEQRFFDRWATDNNAIHLRERRNATLITSVTWPTPNGHKLHIALEELGLQYKVIPVNIGAGDQFKREFLKITPNHRIPAIVDPDGPGGKLIPKDPIGRYKCLEWIMFQMGGVAPMFGQWNHFASYAVEKIPYAIERYTNEVKRLHRVLEHRLAESHWLAGDEYSMADIITFPWVRTAAQTSERFAERGSIDLGDYRAVKRWYDEMAARPAVQRGVAVLADQQSDRQISDTERENTFGATQFAVR